MLEQKLREMGLSEKEAAVFLCVLQYQKIRPTRVALLTKINRPTVYSVAKELIGKGLIAEDGSEKTKYLVSLGERAVENILKSEEQAIEDKKRQLPELIKTLRQMKKRGGYSIPKIRFIDEPELRQFLIHQSLTWAQSALDDDKTWWGFQDHTLIETYQDWADYFWSHFSKEIHLNLFTNKEPVETELMSQKAYARQRHIKYWSGSAEFSATHVVVGEYILMIMTRERPHYCIEIHDRVMADNLREMFKAIWEMI
jgi:DNA-binding MarR family transcriptional regulator